MIIKTDDSNYRNIVNRLNGKLREKNSYLPGEIANRIKDIKETKDGTYGREDPNLQLNKTTILLSPAKPSDTITVSTSTTGELSVENPIPDSMDITIKGKTITFTKKKKKGTGNTFVKSKKNDAYRAGNSSQIVLSYDPFPHATGSPIDEQKMTDNGLNTLTGSITFSNQKAPSSAAFSLNGDSSVKCEKSGQDAIIYSTNGGGIFAPQSCSSIFNGFQAEALDLSSFDTSNVTRMSYMFFQSRVTSLDLSSFDTSNVTDMNNMFDQSQVTSLDLSNFDTSKVTNMRNMFGQSRATLLDLSSFNTSKVTDMYGMFKGAQTTSLDLSSFDTSKVTNMGGMFNNSLATLIDLSSFDTSNVTDMSCMFQYSEVEILDLSGFNTSKVTDMSDMFYSSRATSIDLSSFDTSNVTDMSGMFNQSAATSLDLSSFDTSKVTNMNDMFKYSRVKTVYCRTEADKQKFKTSSGCPSTINFIVGKPTA